MGTKRAQGICDNGLVRLVRLTQGARIATSMGGMFYDHQHAKPAPPEATSLPQACTSKDTLPLRYSRYSADSTDHTVFVSDAEFSDGSTPFDHAEHARDDPDDDEYFSNLNSLGSIESGADNDPDTVHGPCYAKWTDTVRYLLPPSGWVFFLFQFLSVIRPTAQCGGKTKWKMKEYQMMVKAGSPPVSNGLTITESEP